MAPAPTKPTKPASSTSGSVAPMRKVATGKREVLAPTGEVGRDGIIRPPVREAPRLPKSPGSGLVVNGVVLLAGERPQDYDWR